MQKLFSRILLRELTPMPTILLENLKDFEFPTTNLKTGKNMKT